VAVVVRDPDGRDLPPGEVGEICLRAPFLFDGYFRLPERTSERLVAGWYHTRDRGFVLDGEVFVLGRVDDLLILNGRNFHAAEIEALLNDVAGLKPGRNVAFGEFSRARGTNELIVVAETPLDAVAEDADPTRHRVREVLFEGIGLYPAEVLLVPQGWLVKTTSGKIARGANAEKYRHARSAAAA
jgi:fatty-acyl-CoA synthase